MAGSGDDLAHIVHKGGSLCLLQLLVVVGGGGSDVQEVISPPLDHLLPQFLQLRVEGLDQLALVHLGITSHIVSLGGNSLLQN